MILQRAMGRDDLAAVLDWAADEGWNPGLDDAAAFHAADPEGFFLAEEDGAPVAAISVVNHSAEFAFLGLYLCRPSHRGRGIGHALWRQAMAHARDRVVGLDGVPDQQGNYRRSGFVATGETVRLVGTVAGRRLDGIRGVRPSDVPALVALEAAASGTAKPAYLGAWVTDTATRRTFVLETAGRPAGFATIRLCRSGAKLGPIVAPDAAGAEALLHHAAAEMGPDIAVDLPEGADALAARCAEIGLVPGFRTARMYRGTPPAPDGTLWAVTSLELG